MTGPALSGEVRSSLVTLFEQDAPVQRILERATRSIAEITRGDLKAQQIIRAALLQISMTPALQRVDKLSIVQAVMHAASLGLMVGGPAGEAALVPYKGRAQLIPMVRGLVTLAIRSGSVLSVSPRAVFAGEHFEVFYGTRDEILHRPNFEVKRDDDSITHVYTVFKMAGGVQHFDVMNREEIERVRAVSRAKDDGPWVEWWGEQAKKTVTKRGAKMVPLSPEFRAAVELDNRFETGRMNEPSDLLDTDHEVAAETARRTSERTETLKERVKQTRPAAQPCEACGAKPGEPHKADCPYA
jgi:recombination protein RecT